MERFSRRSVLTGALAGLVATGVGRLAAAAEPELGPATPFSFDGLVAAARDLAARPYQAPAIRFPELLDRIDYDAYQQIRFRPDRALEWPGGSYPVQLFHLGRFFKAPVRIYKLVQGSAREVVYTPALFDLGKSSFAADLPHDIGFAGFRAMHPGSKADWLAFLGASYFRSSGELDQYGPSARGIAIDPASSKPEEFPAFTRIWLEEAAPGTVTAYALLDGPSIAGAYRIEAANDRKPVMTIRAELFARADIGRLGVAPLTSMFWYGAHNRAQAIDWRPELHDSDGLALWTGSGERIWRPLNDPSGVRVNAFLDTDPRGFGLLQRDRNFDHYQDDGVFYERRPSLWVEPLGQWGAGAVQLVELPTEDEITDNIVAYWVPEVPLKAGDARSFEYKLHWVAEEPYPAATARVVATRTGVGGIPGQPRPPGLKKFVIDFAGGPLEPLQQGEPVQPVIATSRGSLVNPYCLKVVGTPNWRAVFDLAVDGKEPVDLRCFLKLGTATLTETWLYQYLPA